MKNLILGIILLFLFSCSSNPEKTIERNSEELLIEKPLINYKLNSLPKDINVIFFSNSKIQRPFPEEVKGLLKNYYSFSKRNNYFPTIKFINLNTVSSCSMILNQNAYNFLFFLKNSVDNKPYDLCLNKFISRDTLIISDFDKQSIPNNYRSFLVNRNDDKYELIRMMNSFSNNAMIIDNEFTQDKHEIGEFWKKEFNKEIAEYKTFYKAESSQSIFSNLLLLNQSLTRKRKLSRTISKDLDHKLRARQDIDALFLSVNTQEARNLKPALDYNYFEGMAVFLANDWEEDVEFLKIDKDLEDIISIDMPFMLPSQLPEDLEPLRNRSRNFAIGYDAFQIAMLMKGTRNLNTTIYKGLTGKITFENGGIKRQSTIFKVKNGDYEYFN